MTRVSIFGGTGLIGTHLTLRLLAQGAKVTCIDIREPDLSPLLAEATSNPDFEFIRHNVTRPLKIECDRIYNLASPSYMHHDPSQPVTTLQTNILGSIRTLDLARRNRARLLFASSGDIYLTRNGISSLERHRDDSFYSILSEAKRSAEALHRAYIRQYGVDARVARIYNTYGTGAQIDDGRVVTSIIRHALDNSDIKINGAGDRIRTLCWVGDTVEAMMRLMELDASKAPFALNIGGYHEITIEQLAATVIRLTGSRSRIVTGDPRSNDMRRKVPDLQLTHRTIDWQPTVSLGEGLAMTIEYMRREYVREHVAPPTWVETC